MKTCRIGKVKRVLLTVALVAGILATFSVPVFAIADPNTPPQVSAVYVYENCLEDGDIGVLIDYYLDYDPVPGIPSETVTEAYLAAFIDIDGTTQLKSVAPYTFVDSGYGRGLVWIYFTAGEVSTYGIDQANEALHGIWLMGNPTLSWVGDPPKTVAGIDYWQTAGDTAILIALRVLYYADALELIWAPPLDLVGVTALGNRLTAVGESYFENVILNLRAMAPAAFSVSEISPTIEELDYATLFGATMTDGVAPLGGTVTGSPITFINGFAGTADAGSTNIRIIDAELTQEDDYWNGASLVIATTTDGLPPRRETAIITDFISATDELQFAALSVAVDAGDTYTVAGIRYDGTAGAGSTSIRIRDVGLTQDDDYWNGARLTITTTTDGLPPQGEIAIITDFIAATDELQFATLSASTDIGDTYTVIRTGHTVAVAVTAIGTFVLELDSGTVGTVTDDVGGVVTGSPVTVVAGTNTITVTNVGTLTVDVRLQDTTTAQDDIVAGTGFDLTAVATEFGMSRWFFSGLIWLIISVLICAASYRGTPESMAGGGGAGKLTLVIFNICIIGGVLLGLLKPVVAVGLFLAFGAFTGYVLFYRTANF